MNQSALPALRTTLFLLCSYRRPRDLHSFPTRRSSDLVRQLFNLPHAELLPAQGQDELLDVLLVDPVHAHELDRKSTRLNSSHVEISYAVFCLKKKKTSPPWRSATRWSFVPSSLSARRS